MVKIFGNREFELEKNEGLNPTRVQVWTDSKTGSTGIRMITSHFFGQPIATNDWLTKEELKECIKILDFVEAEEKKINGEK